MTPAETRETIHQAEQVTREIAANPPPLRAVLIGLRSKRGPA
jgi:hypothetical protein